MLRVLLIIICLVAGGSAALAQQNCPATPGAGTSNTTCANTAFVQNQFASKNYVVGPGSSTNSDVALFNGTTGALIKDGGSFTSLIPAGVPTNTLNSQTSNYSIATTDCGKTIQAGTGSTGLFTVTLPAVAGFAGTCTVTVTNGDTAHGKVLSGFPVPYSSSPNNILWPQQTVQVEIINGAWVVTIFPGRWTLTTAQTWNVNHGSGTDTNNDCLGTGAGACATIMNVANIIEQQVDCHGNAPTISNVNETFTESVNLRGVSCLGYLEVFITAASGQPIWTCPAGSSCLSARDQATAQVNGFKYVAAGSGAVALNPTQFGVIDFQNIEFGTFTGGNDIQISECGSMNYTGGSYTVSGNMSNHVFMQGCGNFVGPNGGTISVPNALTFTNWLAIQGPAYYQANTAFSGTGAGAGSTGTKYNITLNGVALTGGSTLPGATPGTTATGGQYN